MANRGRPGRGQQLPVGSVPRFEPTRPLRYTIADIERESGVNARTIRYYVSQGLLPPAYGRGRTATYDSDHLLRLRYIRALKADRHSLVEIAERIGEMSPEAIAVAMRVELEPTYESWRHYLLHEDLDIAVRDHRDAERDLAAEEAIGLIIDYARSVIADFDERTRNHE